MIEQFVTWPRNCGKPTAPGKKIELEEEAAFHDVLDTSDSAVKVLDDQTQLASIRHCYKTCRRPTIIWPRTSIPRCLGRTTSPLSSAAAQLGGSIFDLLVKYEVLGKHWDELTSSGTRSFRHALVRHVDWLT